MKRLKYDGLRRVTIKILLSVLIYTAAMIALGLIIYTWGHSRTWSDLDPNYYFWKDVENNIYYLAPLVFFMGLCLILLCFCLRTCTYFRAIGVAMESIQAEDNAWITLPNDLTETADHMNRIKSQIRESRAQAKEAEQRKNDLVVYLAHDLKTPLTSVLGYLSILEESPDLPAEQRERYLGIAHQKADRLEELINEFFEITRFNLTNVELELRQVNFSLLLKQTIFEFGPMLEEQKLTCRLEGIANAMLYCDPDKIQRVVDNLLRNACFYAYENTEVLLALTPTPTGGLLFTCSNKGPTIPAEKLERIFEQFYRLDNARTSAGGGAGLGLAIARQIVQLHGGSIRAESVNEQTTFTVEFPPKSAS